MALMPAEVYGDNYQYAITVPPYYEGLDIGVYAETVNFTIDDSTFAVSPFIPALREYKFELGGLYWVMFVDTAYTQLGFGERNFFGLFWISTDSLEFRTDQINRGATLTANELNQDYAGNETWVKYRMYHPVEPDKGCDVLFGFNTSVYGSPSEALQDEELTVLVGMGLDDTYSTLNAWRLVGSFFIYNPPDIHPIVNVMIKGVTWSLFAVGCALFIGRFIPLIQGGS